MTVEKASRLLALLDLEAIEENLYRGQNESRGERRLFGGQVLAQALTAAIRTVDEARLPHSLHGYFLRPGSAALPVVYQVERIRDGRSFTTRRVVAIQKGEAIFSLDASFQIEETGLSHRAPMPDVPDPDTLSDEPDARGGRDERSRTWRSRSRPFALRTAATDSGVGGQNAVWIRYKVPVPADPACHAALLAYASDMSFVSTAFMPHGSRGQRGSVQIASLDHAIWFHRQYDVGDWLLYVKESPAAAGARGYNRGQFFSRDGELIASTMQEGLMRQRGEITTRA